MSTRATVWRLTSSQHVSAVELNNALLPREELCKKVLRAMASGFATTWLDNAELRPVAKDDRYFSLALTFSCQTTNFDDLRYLAALTVEQFKLRDLTGLDEEKFFYWHSPSSTDAFFEIPKTRGHSLTPALVGSGSESVCFDKMPGRPPWQPFQSDVMNTFFGPSPLTSSLLTEQFAELRPFISSTLWRPVAVFNVPEQRLEIEKSVFRSMLERVFFWFLSHEALSPLSNAPAVVGNSTVSRRVAFFPSVGWVMGSLNNSTLEPVAYCVGTLSFFERATSSAVRSLGSDLLPRDSLKLLYPTVQLDSTRLRVTQYIRDLYRDLTVRMACAATFEYSGPPSATTVIPVVLDRRVRIKKILEELDS